MADSASASTNGPMCRSTYRRGPSDSTSARRMTSSRCSASAAMCSIWASFGPAGHELGNAKGFRGWSGGARAGFMLSAVNATPGYLAGPIDPGSWALAFGPVVLNPLGMDWDAEIALTRGVQPSLGPTWAVHPAGRLDGRPGWYRGDLHTHTVHSDGRRRITEMAAAATSAGLDFIVSTDHNTNSANRAWAQPRTTAWRSSRVRRSPPATGIGWRSRCLLAAGLTGGTHRAMASATYAKRVRADGGLVVAAQPSVPLPGCAWEFGYRDVDAMGVWNGLWNVDDGLSLRIWQQLLRHDRRITAVGGSDSHASSRTGRAAADRRVRAGPCDAGPRRGTSSRSLLCG